VKLFAPTIFLGAFLLFQVQPLMAKFILPWFGGGPGVWTACMLFFQVFLLAGYVYAHLASRFGSTRVQAAVHMALLLAALIFLPIVPGPRWKPAADTEPTGNILLLLLVCLGLPYLLLASTGPLLQAWFSRLRPGVVPYRLYALSNLASLLALVSYPFVFEPHLTRRQQAGLWSWGFGMFVLLCCACACQLWLSRPQDEPSLRKAAKQLPPPAEGPSPTPARRAWWFLLPACGSVLLLATTNKLCLDVAAVPFLWMLPLSLYLATFIIAFDRPAWYQRNAFTSLLIPLLAALCYTMFQGSQVSLWRQILVYGGTLFLGCLVCHGEVCRLKPAPRFLTSFYLFIAAGGAAGGALVGLVSPLVFHSYAELNWGVWLLAALVFGIHFREGTTIPWVDRRRRLWPAWLIGVSVLGAVLLIQPLRAARDNVCMTRNFYGVLRVSEGAVGTPFHAYKLNHGGITHGLQLASPSLAMVATTYYNEPSGVGVVLKNFPRQTHWHVGVVGLGAGTLATYGRPGDTFTFYEINPEVRRLAETDFNFLKLSGARIEVVPGDARLSLEREAEQHFDVLVLDAFSSDAIPVHLLTQEAFETYLRHLKGDGVIAVHISNHHLDLLPVIVGVAKRFQLMLISVAWDEKPRPWWFSSSNWVILSRNQRFMLSQPVMSHATIMASHYAQDAILWTDDYASLFSIIKH
jgi:hypothetical protein